MTDSFLSLYVINDKFWQPAQFHLHVQDDRRTASWRPFGLARCFAIAQSADCAPMVRAGNLVRLTRNHLSHFAVIYTTSDKGFAGAGRRRRGEAAGNCTGAPLV
jgi:hypothetical protein